VTAREDVALPPGADTETPTSVSDGADTALNRHVILVFDECGIVAC
jgi:hypothetical protein